MGAIVGGVVSLSFDKWIKPHFEAKPNVRVSASSDRPGTSTFKIVNMGEATATDVAVTLWATAPFAARIDVTKVEHAGGTADATCEAGIYEARLMASGSVPSTVNTESQAVLVQCKRINPNEEWRGQLEYQGPEAVFGLLAHIKEADRSENQYARFGQ